MISAGVFWLLTAVVVAIFLGRAWSLGRLAAKSRGQQVRSGVDAVVMLAIVRALFPPPGWTSWLWVVAVVAFGVGVAGAILGWRRSAGERWWLTAVYGLVGAGLVVVLW